MKCQYGITRKMYRDIGGKLRHNRCMNEATERCQCGKKLCYYHAEYKHFHKQPLDYWRLQNG